jgi:predicted nucleic acid-binding protein
VTLTFIDAGVLIAAATLRDPVLGQAAIAMIDDPNRGFVSSGFLRLEVVPKAAFHRRHDEVAFYERFFASTRFWAPTLDSALARSVANAQRWGLNAIDALHVTAAVDLGAVEFITTERPTTPIHRVTALRVIGLFPPGIQTMPLEPA